MGSDNQNVLAFQTVDRTLR